MNIRRIWQLGLLVTTAFPSFSRILINEIHYDPPVKTELTEFIELHNSGTTAVDVSGWAFTEGVTYQFPAETTIPAGGYLVVAENPAALQAYYSTTALGPWEGLLANDGETITLRNALGEVVDEVDYQLGFPWPTVGDLPGYSIELVNPSFDNDLGGNWRRSVRANPVVIPPQVLIPERSTWTYAKGTAEPSSPMNAWRGLNFNDGSWSTGAAPVGYDGNVPMGTTLDDMRYNYTSFYMRKTFQVADPVAIRSLTLATMYDDGIQVWINGRRVVNAGMPDRDVAYNELATGPTRESSAYDQFNVGSPGSFLQAGENVIAVQLHNIFLGDSSDAYADVRLTANFVSPDEPSPGDRNTSYDTNVPPQVRQVEHLPEQPKAGDAVRISAKVTDADGVTSVRLLYQLVEPGNYIELTDVTYETSWTPVTMLDNGTNGDVLAGDGTYTATLPGSLQVHRRLVRYRIEATDGGNRTVRAPYLDDPCPNFAYFVYNGVPAWQGAVQPGSTPEQNFSAAEMGRLETYHLIAKRSSVETATWTSRYTGDEYRWGGTLVYDGKVYDHIRYRARGGVWRYAMGKNMWKFDFNRGHDFEARDNYGDPYKTKWRKLNLGANIQQGNFEHRGEQGMFESVGFRLFNMAGVESPKSHWVNYRIVDEAQEATGNQFSGDYWGLYLAIEQEDGRFLDEHDLPDGNLYKMEGGTGELNNQGRYAATDKSDLNTFLNTYRNTTPTEAWWRQNADLEKIYSYHAIVEGIHHYDICFGKNYFYFLNPVTGQWSIHSWDLDLTWANNMFGASCDDIRDRIITRTPFNTEYKNRVREVRDLLFNTDQAWKVIDEYAGIVTGTNAGPNILAADRSMWDYNSVMANSSIVDLNKAGRGRFYQFPYESANNPSRRGSFEAAVLIMKDYIVERAAVLDNLADDPLIPPTPTITYVGPTNYPVNKIQLTASGLAGSGLNGMQWRVGEVRAAAPGIRGIYEIETAWESPLITTGDANFTLPAEAMRVGRTYRARVKVLDSEGRWSHWSAPAEFTATEPDNSVSLQEFLKLTEIMYNPPAGSDFEYLELYNSSTNITLELDGVTFANGIEYTFPGGSQLLPGESALLVQMVDVAAFRLHYGLLPEVKIFGPYSGSLNNNGERLELLTAVAGTQIFSFEFNDGPGWPKVADGTGHSLEHMAGSYEYGRNWSGSPLIGGTPGGARLMTDDGIVINEVNAHTDYTNPARPEYDSNDWIELFNRGSKTAPGMSVNLRDYYLSDDAADLNKWRLPDVNLPLGGRISFDEVTHFHTPISLGFGLNKAGETVYLSYLPTTGLQRVVDVLRFGGQENGYSAGRYPDGGEFHYTLVPTRDGANTAATASLVIREIMYHPELNTNEVDQSWQEFIEIQNVTSTGINLWNTNGTFRLSGGIDFTFPVNFSLSANGLLVITSFSPTNSTELARFKNFYGVGDSNIVVVGPFTGQLANSSDRITLEKPDAPDAIGEPIVWVTVDEVIYTDASGADGTSESLNRALHTRTGNDPANMFAAAPTPGFKAEVTDGDRDDDGMPDEWELIFGFDPDSAADSLFDSDNDGLLNFEEYRAGTNPQNAESRFDLEVVRAGSAAAMTFEAIPGKTYSVLYADDLEAGEWQKLRDVSGVSGAVTVNDPSPLESGRFYRLVTPSEP